jgi:hypothetical protein
MGMVKAGVGYDVTQIETGEAAESDVVGSDATTSKWSVPSSSGVGIPLKVRVSGSNDSHDERDGTEKMKDALFLDEKVFSAKDQV